MKTMRKGQNKKLENLLQSIPSFSLKEANTTNFPFVSSRKKKEKRFNNIINNVCKCVYFPYLTFP